MKEDIIKELKILSKNSNKIVKLLEKYNILKENPTDNAHILEKRLSEISKIADGMPDFESKRSLISRINQEKNELEKAKEDFRFKFGQELKKLLQETGKQMRGQYPLLRIGLYTLKLNFEFGEAILYFGPEVEKLKSKIPLQAAMIFRAIKNYDEELQKMKFEPEAFFKDLNKAYKNRLILSNRPYGEKLLITEVLGEFIMLKQSKQFFIDPKKEHFREYPRFKLSYLFYLLKKSNLYQKGIRLHVATFDATTDKLHSFWIPENEDGDGSYYSYISIEKTKNS
jgi:hypothetical protein